MAEIEIGVRGHGGRGPAPETNLRELLAEAEKQAAALNELLRELEGRLFGFRPEPAQVGKEAPADPNALSTAVRLRASLSAAIAATEDIMRRA